MMPDDGAGTSSTTLSVSRSTRFSSRPTLSPGCLCHETSVASVTDSGSCGTLTSILIDAFLFLARGLQTRGLTQRFFGTGRAQRCVDESLLLFGVHLRDTRGRRRCRRTPCVEQLMILRQRLLQAMADLIPAALIL